MGQLFGLGQDDQAHRRKGRRAGMRRGPERALRARRGPLSTRRATAARLASLVDDGVAQQPLAHGAAQLAVEDVVEVEHLRCAGRG